MQRRNLRNVRHFTRRQYNYLEQEWSESISYLNPPFNEIDQALEKVYESIRAFNNTFLMILPMWEKTKWFEKVISFTSHPILILPGLNKEVFTNTERQVQSRRKPNWKAMAVLMKEEKTKSDRKPSSRSAHFSTSQTSDRSPL